MHLGKMLYSGTVSNLICVYNYGSLVRILFLTLKSISADNIINYGNVYI